MIVDVIEVGVSRIGRSARSGESARLIGTTGEYEGEINSVCRRIGEIKWIEAVGIVQIGERREKTGRSADEADRLTPSVDKDIRTAVAVEIFHFIVRKKVDPISFKIFTERCSRFWRWSLTC